MLFWKLYILVLFPGEVDDDDDDDDDDEYLEIDDELQKSVPARADGKSDSSKTQCRFI